MSSLEQQFSGLFCSLKTHFHKKGFAPNSNMVHSSRGSTVPLHLLLFCSHAAEFVVVSSGYKTSHQYAAQLQPTQEPARTLPTAGQEGGDDVLTSEFPE